MNKMPLPPPSARTPASRTAVPALAMALPLLGVAVAAGLAWLLIQFAALPAVAVAALAAAIGVGAASVPLALLVRKALAAVPAPARPAPLTDDGTIDDDSRFADRALRELARAQRHGQAAALLLVEVDRKARLPEAQMAGLVDRALRTLLRQIEPTLRGADLLARHTPTQLAVLLSPSDAPGALDVAERIRQHAEQIEITFTATGQRVRVAVSIGVALTPPGDANPADLAGLLHGAAAGVAAARLAGGNCARLAPVDAMPVPPLGQPDDRRARPQ
ncbi:Diguanylate cyclase (GGDEF)-like protein [Rubrivivax sp. A210]|uniref:diguanylate cyclase domain-containing protein n=1 Tax=Rubrivivax sp. A210 TaxID=2772301 RepID=UPI0019194FD0|nr:diguanylate cyclase [Rubrivivax sp. A210]CAD5371928.1 Diguanylate cyclase (GGDEF)-like protein [Rubrivivax sp. A210]